MSTGAGQGHFERGQAMTEFVIAATFVLVPLFIFVPMLGKYIDFKHAAIQAARYQAWEYTVWYEDTDDRDILDNFDSGIANYLHPEKTVPDTRNESRIRMMSTVGNELTGTPGDTTPGAIRYIQSSDAGEDYTPNAIWTDHRGLPFFADGDMTINAVNTDDDTPTITIFGVDVGSVLSAIVDVVQSGFNAIAKLLNPDDTAAAAGFSAMHTDGFSHVDFDAEITVPQNVIFLRDELGEAADTSTRTLGFNAKAGVLAAGWNAGGTDHTYLQVSGTTPSTLVNALLNLPLLDEVWTAISFIAPELSRCYSGSATPISPLAAPDGHLWLGYVDGDVVHVDRLSELGGDPDDRLGNHACDDAGRCIWDDDAWADWAPDPPLGHSDCIP